jgi:hypothetical protein
MKYLIKENDMRISKLLFLICFCLTSCSKPKFTCKPGLGVNCKSTQEIYSAIQEDRLEELIEETNNPKKNKKSTKKACNDCSHKNKSSRSIQSHQDAENGQKSSPFRVWIAPFVSEEGYNIGEHYIEVR